jgi:hypothetical protein
MLSNLQYWSAAGNLCTVPTCTQDAVTVRYSPARTPGWCSYGHADV